MTLQEAIQDTLKDVVSDTTKQGFVLIMESMYVIYIRRGNSHEQSVANVVSDAKEKLNQYPKSTFKNNIHPAGK